MRSVEHSKLIGPVSDGRTTGYIDWNGNWVLTFKYEKIGKFREGLAAFVKEGKLGFFDIEGREVIAPRFDPVPLTLPQFREGVAPVFLDEKATLVNKEGELEVPPRTGIYWNFIQGKALFATEGRFSVIDRGGVELAILDVRDIPFLYDFPQDWECFPCLIDLRPQFRRAWINWRGDYVFPPIYCEVGSFFESIAPFAPNDQFGPWGLVRITTEVVVPPTFFSISGFSEGLAAAAQEKKKFGYINNAGEWVISPIYQQALPFNEGLACVTVPGKDRHGRKGFINRQGEMVIEPRFQRQASFQGGWAAVQYGDKQQIIDQKGNVIWEAELLESQ